MSNPWGVTLKKTGLTEERLNKENQDVSQIQQNQKKLQTISKENLGKTDTYKDRQSSLAADATYGQQGRYNYGGKKKSKKHRKSSRRHKKHRKTIRYHKRK